jgi:hypothetical protein
MLMITNTGITKSYNYYFVVFASLTTKSDASEGSAVP